MKTRLKLITANLFLFLAVVGPGIITASVDNDAGGITTYSIAGAQFGYALLWLLIPITVMLIIVQEMSARLGVVTGKGLADLIRENFRLKLTFVVMSLLVLVNFGNIVAEFAGIAAASLLFGINPFILVPLSAVLVWLLVLKGNYNTVEKIFLVASLFYVSYILSGLLVNPPWPEIAQAIVMPQIDLTSAFFFMVVALIGTTIAPWMQFYLQSSIVEKGIKVKDYKFTRIDVIIGSIIVSTVAAFIIITNAVTIFAAGEGAAIATAEDAARALVPLAGGFAALLFGIGLFNAGFFSAAILPLSTTYSVCEAFGWESGINKTFKQAPQFYVLFSGLIFSAALLILLLPLGFLIGIMFLSQAINGLLLPVILFLLYGLVNDKELMGDHVNGWKLNALTIITIAITLIANFFLLLSVFGFIQ